MTWDTIAENWDSYKSLALAQWPRLTEADITRAAGKWAHLVDLLRNAYGLSLEEAAQLVDGWAEDVEKA